MSKKIGKKLNILFFEVILLILILYGKLILRHYNKKNKSFELSKNCINNIKTFELSQNYISKFKTFEFLMENELNNPNKSKLNLDYVNVNFAVIKRTSCSCCGLFSNYMVYLGCIRKYLIEGFIPILEFISYKNTINGFMIDPSKGNPWEYYFNQPFGYKYNNVIRKARNIKYFECNVNTIKPNEDIFINKEFMKYWHIMANKYIPIKKEIINESNHIIKRIFKESNNVLGYY